MINFVIFEVLMTFFSGLLASRIYVCVCAHKPKKRAKLQKNFESCKYF